MNTSECEHYHKIVAYEIELYGGAVDVDALLHVSTCERYRVHAIKDEVYVLPNETRISTERTCSNAPADLDGKHHIWPSGNCVNCGYRPKGN